MENEEQIQQDEAVSTNVEESHTESSPESTEEPKEPDYRAKLNATNHFLEKEGYEFKEGKWVKPKEEKPAPTVPQSVPQSDLTTTDILYLSRAAVHEDDIEEVVKEAKLRGVSVKEAHDFLKPILDVRNEQRRTAHATQKGSGRGVAKVSGEELLIRAESTGEVPDTPEGMQALAAARLARLRHHK